VETPALAEAAAEVQQLLLVVANLVATAEENIRQETEAGSNRRGSRIVVV